MDIRKLINSLDNKERVECLRALADYWTLCIGPSMKEVPGEMHRLANYLDPQEPNARALNGEELDMLKRGRKLDAIKSVKFRLNLGFMEARDLVKRYL